MNPIKKLFMRKDLATIVTTAWMVVIFYLSHQPGSQSSDLSGSLLDIVLAIIALLPITIDADIVHFFVRKSAHFIAYLILGLLVAHSLQLFYRLAWQIMTMAFVITIVYAISDEFHQTFIPGRSGEFRDVLVDSAGSLTGILAYSLMVLLYNKLRSRCR